MKQNSAIDYSEVSKALGVRIRFARWGLHLLPRDPNGKVYRLFQIVALDGWIFDPDEIIRAIRLDDYMGIKYPPDMD